MSRIIILNSYFQVQGPPPPYPSNIQVKRFKDANSTDIQAGNPPTQPSFFLTQQQLQMLQYLQQKQILNAQEEMLLQQLNSQYKLMEQYQQGVVQQNSTNKLDKSKNDSILYETEQADLPPPCYYNSNMDPSILKTNSKFQFVENNELGK